MQDFSISTTPEPLLLTSQRAHRALAVQMLYALDRQEDENVGPEKLLEQLHQYYGLQVDPDALALRIVRGVLADEAQLLETINKYTKNWTLDRIGCLTKIILKIALFEFAEQRLPAPVIIDEAVELAKAFCEHDAYKFINGLLDKAFKLSGMPPVTQSRF